MHLLNKLFHGNDTKISFTHARI